MEPSWLARHLQDEALCVWGFKNPMRVICLIFDCGFHKRIHLKEFFMNINRGPDMPKLGQSVVDAPKNEVITANKDGSIFRDNRAGDGRINYQANGSIDVTTGTGADQTTRHIDTKYKDARSAYANVTNDEMGIHETPSPGKP
jgi:hypothetical protein